MTESGAWRLWIVNETSGGFYTLGLCSWPKCLWQRRKVALDMRQRMENRLQLFCPEGMDCDTYWWDDNRSRAVACGFLAAMAND